MLHLLASCVTSPHDSDSYSTICISINEDLDASCQIDRQDAIAIHRYGKEGPCHLAEPISASFPLTAPAAVRDRDGQLSIKAATSFSRYQQSLTRYNTIRVDHERKIMISEGLLQGDRISRAIRASATSSGYSATDLEEVFYLLAAASFLRHGTRLPTALSSTQTIEFNQAVDQLLGAQVMVNVIDAFEKLMSLLERICQTRVHHPWSDKKMLAITIEQAAYLIESQISSLEPDVVPSALDTIFYRLIARHLFTNVKHDSIVAACAGRAAGAFDKYVEWEPTTGDYLIDASHTEAQSASFILSDLQSGLALPPWPSLFRNLRLLTHGIDTNLSGSFSSDALTVLDLSNRLLKLSRVVVNNNITYAKPLELLTTHLGHNHRPTIVVIGGKDRLSPANTKNLRRELAEEHELRAIIDLHSFTGNRRTTITLWYFGPQFPWVGDKILALDARALCRNSRLDEMTSCAALIGTLLKCWITGSGIRRSELVASGASARAIAFVEKGIERNEHDVPGLLRFVEQDELAHSEYHLSAGPYVRHAKPAWESQVEIEPVINLLNEQGSCRCVYIIGNNGSGKSLALRDAATALAQNELRSTGIAFSFYDRFNRLSAIEPTRSFFTYAGTTSLRGLPNYKRWMSDLAEKVKSIYRDSVKTGCFEHSLSVLGFRLRQFLVPLNMDSTVEGLDDVLADIYPISSEHSANLNDRAIIDSLDKEAYKLAFMRADSQEIIIFDALSSGEQQILTMIIKAVALASAGTVVLIDEPEISLHVAWQRRLPEVFHALSVALDCKFVIATHSPVLIASANNDEDFCFLMRNKLLTLLLPEQRRSVESSLFEGFETHTPNTHHIQERCAEIVSKLIAETSNDGAGMAFEQECISQLKELKLKLEQNQSVDAARDISLVSTAMAAIDGLTTDDPGA
ncbi:AAA family ATPase [Pigmentiphaga litoralis]|uniref:AAA family ATPase n=1 Tax=Pigmentiphaga litoralis TaxID=516702 RepID=UPI003B429FE2